MSIRKSVLFFLAFVLLMGYILWNFENSNFNTVENSHNPEHSPKFFEDREIILYEEENQNASYPSNSFQYDELNMALLANSNVLKDLTIGFDSLESMELFLSGAENNGIEILDQMDELTFLRIRVSDLSKAAQFMDQWESEPQYNYPVRAPVLPRAEYLEGEKSFGPHANEWLGVVDKREEWGRGVKVAILDSGVDRLHDTLDGAFIEEVDLVGGAEISKGHGTAIASIIAGSKPNQLGLSPAVSLLSMRVLDEKGEGNSFTVAQGIIEATDRGANVINLSLGGAGRSEVMKNAVDYAHENGVLIVAAVGNEGVGEVSYPAKFENVIGVSSVDANGRQSSFANYGDGVDIAAPGVGVYTAWENEEMVAFSGTSVATAFISGALASEISKNPSLLPNQVVDLIYEYSNESEKPGFDEFTGNGILNMGRIENRNTPNINDGAIVGYYFDPKDMQGGTTPFLVSVQNQGTSWLNNVNLEVKYRGVVRNFLFNDLDPGETRSEQLFLDGTNRSENGVRISSKLTIGTKEDYTPDNNTRVSTISLP
jgi:thermitase